jgi:hypothetical protein
MHIRWEIIVLIIVILVVLLFFIIVRNKKDKEELEDRLKQDYRKPGNPDDETEAKL